MVGSNTLTKIQTSITISKVKEDDIEPSIGDKTVRFLEKLPPFINREKIIHEIVSVIKFHMNNPNSTLLGVGRVQSGKTLVISGAVALALDNIFHGAIVAVGKDKELYGQNSNEIETHLGLKDSELRPYSFYNASDVFSENIKEDIISDVKQGKKFVITILKNWQHINKVREIIEEVQKETGVPLSLFITDDEGDQITPNGGENNDLTTTYQNFLNLKNSLGNTAIFSVTATPQALLLINLFDFLSPKRTLLIEPGPQYTGSDKFHGELREQFIRNIPDNEAKFKSLTLPPESLINSLCDYFVASHFYFEKTHRPSEMLIHTHTERNEHDKAHRFTLDYIAEIEGAIDFYFGKESDVDKERSKKIIGLIMKSYKELRPASSRKMPKDEFLKTICLAVKDTSITIINGRTKKSIKRTTNKRHNIYIGGTMVERGVSFQRLLVTYLSRSSSQIKVDVLAQLARWWGYRSNYIEFCRVYLPSKLQTAYESYVIHEIELWKTLKQFSKEDSPNMKNWINRLFNLPGPLYGPRANVADYFYTRSGWHFYNRPCTNQDLCTSSIESIEKFFENADVQQFGNRKVPHKVIKSCRIEDVIQFLKTIRVSETSRNELERITEYLLMLQGRTSDIDVLLLSKANGKRLRNRSTIGTGLVDLMQGRTETEEGITYPGDRHLKIPGSNNDFQLQFHVFNKISVDVTTFGLALKMPGRFIEKDAVNHE